MTAFSAYDVSGKWPCFGNALYSRDGFLIVLAWSHGFSIRMTPALTWDCYHFEIIWNTGCNGNCHFDNFKYNIFISIDHEYLMKQQRYTVLVHVFKELLIIINAKTHSNIAKVVIKKEVRKRIGPWGIWMKFQISNFHSDFSNWWLR